MNTREVDDISLFHFHVTQISRAAGQSAIAQLLQKWNEDLCVRSVRRDIIAYDVLADRRYIYVIAGLYLPVP